MSQLGGQRDYTRALGGIDTVLSSMRSSKISNLPGEMHATWQAGRWVAIGLLAYLALLTGPLGAARFLMPAWPLLLGLALMGLRGPATPATSAASA